MDCTTDTRRLGEQIHQSLLGYSTAMTTREIAETLYIINTDIKYYMAQQFPQVQQPVESDPEEYENESNNPITAQAKSMVNKKPSWTKSLGEYRLLFGNLTPAAGQTEGNPSTWEQPPAQNLAESVFPLTEETAILQPIGSSDKGKQPSLASKEHLNTQTPIPLNITSNTPLINRIMAYRDIAKLEKFSGEKDNAYFWIVDAEKAITANAIERDYYTMAQVLNQFIKELWSSILRSIKSCHLTSLQDAITLTCDFESAEQKANHTQAINLAINETSDIGAKITQLSKKLTQKIEEFLAGTTETYQPLQQKENNNNNRYSQQQNYLILATVTTTRNLDTLKPIPTILISTKHDIPIFYISESTVPICTTSSIHSTTAPELLLTTTNNTNNPSLLNFPLQPIQISMDCLDQFLVVLPNLDQHQLDTQIKLPILVFHKTRQTKSNIPPATIIKNTILAVIFLFDINNLNTHSLFSGAAINQDKPIMALYTNARIGRINIKLILDSGSAVDHAVTAQIITADGNTKILIRKIDNFPFKINRIQISTKHARVPATCKHFKTQHLSGFIEKRKGRAEEEPQLSLLGYITSDQRNLFYQPPRLICVNCEKKLFTMGTCIGDNEKWLTVTKYYCKLSSGTTHHVSHNDVLGREGTCDEACQYTILINDWNAWKQAFNRLDSYPHNNHKIWRMASAKTKDAMPEKIREIKDNPWMPKYNGPNYPKNDFFTDNPNKLAPTCKEQEQRLADLNTKLCNHCLIPCYFQYCNVCNLMFNLPPRILFPITKLPEPKEEEILITEDMLFQDPTVDIETEQYLAYSDLSKELELK
ncbi:hypothetical protein G9A89_007729 [Geosiphon pyriformis]|nr:hypothetical protein G9A89_007729 [Geosiphon pyriformis]